MFPNLLHLVVGPVLLMGGAMMLTLVFAFVVTR